MAKFEVLVLDDRRSVPPELQAALRGAGARVTVRSPAQVLAAAAGQVPSVDVLLASAALSTHTVRAVRRRLEEEQGQQPMVVAFTEHDFVALERHVRSGAEYLVPPFRPAFVHSRLRTCSERAEFTRTIREIESQAELVRYERELEIGREIQLGFLPEALPEPEGWCLDVRYRPARTVAGDFYDAFELVNRRRLALVVADVCDKGVGAALFMALIRSLLRHTAEQSEAREALAGPIADERLVTAAGRVTGAAPLINAVVGTNDYLTRNHIQQGYFATMFFCVLDPATGRLVYVNGGHNPPLLVRGASGETTMLEPTGPAVGVVPNCVYSLGHACLEPGDSLFLYTDGVTEARSEAREFFGEHRLRALLTEGPRERVLERIDSALHDFVGEAEQADDITMMLVQRAAVPA